MPERHLAIASLALLIAGAAAAQTGQPARASRSDRAAVNAPAPAVATPSVARPPAARAPVTPATDYYPYDRRTGGM